MKQERQFFQKATRAAIIGLGALTLAACSQPDESEANYEETEEKVEYSEDTTESEAEDYKVYNVKIDNSEQDDFNEEDASAKDYGIVDSAYLEFAQNKELKEQLQSEISMKTGPIPSSYTDEDMTYYEITHEGKTMKFFMEEKGECDENGLTPLYITLHGGGGAEPEENNDQWMDMFEYYKDAVDNGIYIACRGITDTWDLHFQEDSYMLYDRLIEAMIVNYNVDPDRVYLLGFSAGGDGVYQIAPRLADRFAAVNMSSGHPNGVNLLNMANCPISFQVGILDYYTEDVKRSVRAAEFEKTLSDYHDKYGFGYEHKVWVHVPTGHNYIDYEDSDSLVLKSPEKFADIANSENIMGYFQGIAEIVGIDSDVMTLSYYSSGIDAEFDEMATSFITDDLGLETTVENTNAVAYVSQFVRNPAPEQIVWDLSTRAPKREKDTFYWLEADASVDSGVITASVDKDTNTITVEPDEKVNGDFAILLHPELVDISRPLTIKTKDISKTIDINPSADYLRESMLENGDPKLACFEKIMYSSLFK